ncbi:MAG: glycerophosphodiester phosphodiesterase family protein [Pseudomonadota bacterium]
MIPPLPPGFLDRPFAHRALHDGTGACPENSLPAIRAACAIGYGIEVDVQLSSDGRAMVFHDHDLERLTGGAGPVRAQTSAALQDARLLGGTAQVPTLAACLDEIAGRVPLLIEIKDQDGGLGPDIGALEEAVARDIAWYDGPLAVMSFNPHSTAAMRDLAPDVCRGLTTCDFAEAEYAGLSEARRAALAGITDFKRAGAAFVSHDRNDLSNPAVTRLKAAGVPILCWTVRSAEQEHDAREVADQITFEGYVPA